MVFPSGDQAAPKEKFANAGKAASRRSLPPATFAIRISISRRSGTPRMNANCLPSGEKLTALSTSRINWRGAPPTTGIT